MYLAKRNIVLRVMCTNTFTERKKKRREAHSMVTILFSALMPKKYHPSILTILSARGYHICKSMKAVSSYGMKTQHTPSPHVEKSVKNF